jgi:hypothetical protein
MQHSASKPLSPSVFHQEAENTSADSFTTPFAQYRHPANFHITIMRYHPAAADRPLSVQRERVKRIRVICVYFDFFRHMLFLDEDGAPNRPRLLHLGAFSDLDYSDLCGHRF